MQSSFLRRVTRLQARLHHWLTRPSPVRYVAIGYLSYMAVGWALLALPVAQQVPLAAVDALFIAVSAVSTTGLVTVDPGASFTLFGEVVILALIQVGGLGFMTIGSFAWAALSGPTGPLRERVARMVFSVAATEDVRRFLRRVVVFSLVVEAAGALALWPLFLAAGVENAAWAALFTSVSAFCTAGFALFPDSLESFAADPLVLGVVAVLSLLGALGFLVVSEVWDRLRGRRAELGFTCRLVLRALPLMILAGTALLLIAEPSVLARPWPEALAAALFQSLSAATTVGFNSIPTAGLVPAAVMVLYVLMLVGASPSGTGGGLKVTTVAVLAALVRATARGESEVRVLGVPVREERVRQAASVLGLALAVLGLALFALSLTEDQPFDRLLFEALSALGTVGLSLGVTAELGTGGKLVIVALMAIGRIGVLGFAVAVAARARREAASAAAPADVAL
ncbi:TrkH family potassium uptake protein [Falsiroseomonas oryziterrae]|uniref:TrkH family potassium uptake protein n=1 Tax=Falsiroseomonas oryziterrae TaxID=2911368 RepID=UPI001F29F707|nr:potassium transporter TrkG [Roseomonas sp. NPKOSM-4]